MNQSSRTALARALERDDVPTQPAAPGVRCAGELFLEALQQRVYGSVGLTAEDCQQREWVGQQTILPLRLQQKAEQLTPAEFAQYRSAVLEALTRDELLPRPTAFERPHQYSILRGLKTSIEDAASQLSIPLPFTPVVGTLPTRLLEPLMIRVPSSEEVVLVVDGGLLTYVHLLAKAVAHALPYEFLDGDAVFETPEGTGWHEAIDPEGAATHRFAELILAAMTGNAASAPAYAPEPICEQLTASLCECMELFIVGREYARLCEGFHLVAGSERRRAFDQPFDALVWDARQEFQADALGLGLMLAAADDKGESPRVALWAADILLASFGVLDRAVLTLENPMPTPLMALPATIFDERRRRLRQLMTHLAAGSMAVRFVESLDAVMNTLAERFEIILHDVHYGPRPTH